MLVIQQGKYIYKSPDPNGLALSKNDALEEMVEKANWQQTGNKRKAYT